MSTRWRRGFPRIRPMNWRLSMLDDFQLVSSSDAHSPAKLGREATLFEGELSCRA